MYNFLSNLFKVIKGKEALQIENLLEEHLTETEKFKKNIYSLIASFSPFLITYIVLIINQDAKLFGSSLNFILFIIILYIISRRVSIEIGARYLAIAKLRQEETIKEDLK